MIAEVSHSVGTPALRTYLTATVAGHFAGVRLHVSDPDRRPLPTILYATHVAWWDGHLGLVACRALGLDLRVLMLSRELERFPFLRYAGAFGFEPENAADVRAAMRHSAVLLSSGTPIGLLLFPSGEILRQGRPQPFRPGTAWLAAHAAPSLARPVAIAIEHGATAKPRAYMRVGPARAIPEGIAWRDLLPELQAALTGEAEALDSDLDSGRAESYPSALGGLPSAPDAWAALRQRLGRPRGARP